MSVVAADKILDYDRHPKGGDPEAGEDPLESLKIQYAAGNTAATDLDPTDVAESPELPGADLSNLSGEALTERVVPQQTDEFVCARCFLIQNRRRIAATEQGLPICQDCA